MGLQRDKIMDEIIKKEALVINVENITKYGAMPAILMAVLKRDRENLELEDGWLSETPDNLMELTGLDKIKLDVAIGLLVRNGVIFHKRNSRPAMEFFKLLRD